MDFMAHGTLCNVTSRGQGALSMIAALVHDRGREDSKELHGFLSVTSKGEIQEKNQVSWIASRVLALCRVM